MYMANDDWRDRFRSRSGPGTFAHPDSPAGGAGTGSSRRPGPQGYCWPSARVPHPNSPAGRHFDWQLELSLTEHQERDDLARQIEDVEDCLAKQSDGLRDSLPDDSLRTIYERQVGEIKGRHTFDRPLGSTAPDLPTLLQKLQIALNWFDPQLYRSSHKRPGFGIAIGKAYSLWGYGTLQEKKGFLKGIQTLAEQVYEAAKRSIQEQLAEAKRTHKQEELIGKWKTRSLQRIVQTDSIEGTAAAAAEAVAREQRRGEAPPVRKETVPEKKLHWIEVRLVPLPDTASRKKWWPPDQPVTYSGEPFEAEVTDGHKGSTLDGSGSSRYDRIPGGTCSWKFTRFFDRIESALKPGPPVKDAKSLAGPTRQ
jgi:hypothetical protein